MRMDDQLDHGPILATLTTPIGAREDAAELSSRLADSGALLLVETLSKIEHLMPVEQDHTRATVAQRLRREDGQLEWSMGADDLDRHVRALQPWPGVTLPTVRGRVKVLSGHLEGDRYVPDVVQLPGRRPAPASNASRRRPAIVTMAPSAANVRAMAAPMPEPPPVTSACLPSSIPIRLSP